MGKRIHSGTKVKFCQFRDILSYSLYYTSAVRISYLNKESRRKGVIAMFRLAIIFCCLLISGCSRAIEPNDLAYIVAVGVDVNESEGYNITLQVANPQAISGGADEGGGEAGKRTISNLTVPAGDIFSAVNLANHLYSKNLSLAHAKLIAVCDEIATSGELKDLSETLARSEEIRPNTFLTVVRGKAEEYLNSINPTNEVNPVKYYEVIYDVQDTAYIPKNQLRSFYAFNQSSERENVLPLSAVSGSTKTEGTQNEYDGLEYLNKNYLAGEIDSEGGIETQTCGMAVFRDGKKIAECGGVDALIYNILTGDYVMSEVSYKNKATPTEAVVVTQSQRRKPKIKVDISGERPVIDIKIFLDADLRTVNEGYIIEMDIEDFEGQVTSEIKQAAESFLYKTAQVYKSDIIGFGSHIKKSFKSFADFSSYNWEKKYPQAEFNVEVDFKVRRSGMINKKLDR